MGDELRRVRGGGAGHGRGASSPHTRTTSTIAFVDHDSVRRTGGDAATHSQARRLGANAIFGNPFDLYAFRDTVRRLLRRTGE